MLLEVTEKISLGRNARYNFIHRIHSYCYYLLFLLLFTVYTITVTVLLLSLYHLSVLRNIILITLIELNNNVNGQLTSGLEKLKEETTSVFWVDLGYRLHS